MAKEDFKTTFGKDFNIEGIKSGVDAMLNKVMPQFDKIIAEQRKLSMPISKKNIAFLGKQINVSHIEGGRVLIQLQSQEDSKKAYDELEKFDVDVIKNLEKNVIQNYNRAEKLETENVNLEHKICEFKDGIYRQKLGLEYLHKELKDIKSKWWYKFFSYFSK